MVNCIEILWKPKSSSEDVTQLLGYLIQSITFCDSDAERKLVFATRGYCEGSFHIYHPQSTTLTLWSK